MSEGIRGRKGQRGNRGRKGQEGRKTGTNLFPFTNLGRHWWLVLFLLLLLRSVSSNESGSRSGSLAHANIVVVHYAVGNELDHLGPQAADYLDQAAVRARPQTDFAPGQRNEPGDR